ncbi:hypothetical protein COJ96_25230 [Bacillus sp. AFS073361]|uniref:hypothetical protein n=1 Tax=Bacillus sp. AFS073361 TaxID=2033511 RepID=UPI000BF2C6BB|nr:hypothetical protein [Bacillus sp. AFS073361]PFP22709.1 hypothetical protein COJ96_25230 [Bacillus sp. AFS073361]
MEKRYYVYAHTLDGIIFYVGSNCGTKKGFNPNRAWNISIRNKKYKKFVGDRLNDVEVEILEWLPIGAATGECQSREIRWIHLLHDLGLAQCSAQDSRGSNNGMFGKGHIQTGDKNPMYGKTPTNACLCILYKEGNEIGKFSSVTEARRFLESKIDGNLEKGLQKIIKGTWTPTKKSQLYGYSLKYI